MERERERERDAHAPSAGAAAWSYIRAANRVVRLHVVLNLLTPNVNYSGRTAPLTSKVAFYIFIQQI